MIFFRRCFSHPRTESDLFVFFERVAWVQNVVIFILFTDLGILSRWPGFRIHPVYPPPRGVSSLLIKGTGTSRQAVFRVVSGCRLRASPPLSTGCRGRNVLLEIAPGRAARGDVSWQESEGTPPCRIQWRCESRSSRSGVIVTGELCKASLELSPGIVPWNCPLELSPGIVPWNCPLELSPGIVPSLELSQPGKP
jgi:hypothetical protein